MKNEIMKFEFSEEKHQVRSMMDGDEISFVGTDCAKILGYANPRKAIRDHCRYVTKRSIPHPQNPNKQIEVSVIPESDMYRLIMKSELPSAEKFERWVMEDVLPTLRKTGKYQMNASKREDYIDLRHETYTFIEINKKPIRVLQYEGQEWLSLTDRNKAIGVTTGAVQQVKTLSASMALKIWVYGCTNPSWFVTRKAFALLELGTRKAEPVNERQLNLFIS